MQVALRNPKGERTGYAVLFLSVLFFSLLGFLVVHWLGGMERIAGFVSHGGRWSPIIYIGMKSLTYVVAPLSGAPLKIASGAIWDVWPATTYSVIGDTLGASINYVLAAKLGRNVITRFGGSDSLAKLDHLQYHLGSLKGLIFARVILAPIYDLVSYAAGLARVSFPRFVSITLVFGYLPTIVFVGFGSIYATIPISVIVSILAGSGVLLQVWKHKRRG